MPKLFEDGSEAQGMEQVCMKSAAISLKRIADELAENNRIFRIVAQSHERANDKARREGSD